MHSLEVELGGKTFSTGWVENSGFPLFNSTFEFQHVKPSSWLRLTIWHRRTWRENKRVAETHWNLLHIPFSEEKTPRYQGWVPLQHKERVGAELLVDVRIRGVPPDKLASFLKAFYAPPDESDASEREGDSGAGDAGDAEIDKVALLAADTGAACSSTDEEEPTSTTDARRTSRSPQQGVLIPQPQRSREAGHPHPTSDDPVAGGDFWFGSDAGWGTPKAELEERLGRKSSTGLTASSPSKRGSNEVSPHVKFNATVAAVTPTASGPPYHSFDFEEENEDIEGDYGPPASGHISAPAPVELKSKKSPKKKKSHTRDRGTGAGRAHEAQDIPGASTAPGQLTFEDFGPAWDDQTAWNHLTLSAATAPAGYAPPPAPAEWRGTDPFDTERTAAFDTFGLADAPPLSAETFVGGPQAAGDRNVIVLSAASEASAPPSRESTANESYRLLETKSDVPDDYTEGLPVPESPRVARSSKPAESHWQTAPSAAEQPAPPSFEPVAPPSFEPVAPPSFEPVAPPSFEPVAPPTFEPVAPPTFEPVAPPTFEPVAPP
eukprot:Polyplicarium_translucidae@DN301_c0_g1_i1.p1